MDFDIIIAHRGPAMGLWATIESCEIDLAGQPFDYRYHIISNGEKKVDTDLERVRHFLEKAGKLGKFDHYEEPLSPPQARQRGTIGTTGTFLFFFDNHCLVARDYFRRAIADFNAYNMDMLHSATRFYTGEFTHYHYRLKLKTNFWGDASPFAQHEVKPYRLAAGGHGGFAVRRDVWEEVGGYGPDDLFAGYGGEEMYFDLKMALLGKTNWIDPKVIHYHFAGKRDYARHYTDDYYRNMMQCALMIGGREWMYRVYEHFADQPKQSTGVSMYELMTQAEERGAQHAAYLASIRKYTLEEVLTQFSKDQVAVD